MSSPPVQRSGDRPCRWGGRCAALLATWALVTGCRDAAPAVPDPVLLIGVDGLEWSVALPLLERGEMPRLAAWMAAGAYGRLETTRPTFSPIIWTTIATGKSAAEHGIRGFVHGGKEGRRLYTSADRRTKALWNVASDLGRGVAVVGWWNTFPAEPIQGVMVAQTHTLDQADRTGGRAILKGGLFGEAAGQVHPAARSAEVLSLAAGVASDLDGALGATFSEFRQPLPPLEARLWENTRWAFAADAAYLTIAGRLAAEGFDLMMVYVGGVDVVGHRFWRYMEPAAYDYPPPAEQIENFAGVIATYYRYLDRRLGELADSYARPPTVIVVSDHGMRPVNRGKPFASDAVPDDVNSAHHHRAPPGVLVAAGPGIRRRAAGLPPAGATRDDLPRVGSVFDVAPTVLALLRLPAGEDMPGRVLEQLLTMPEVTRIATHDTPGWRRRMPVPPAAADDAERLEQLRALGYID